MRVRLVRRPGQHGTRTYVEQHGDRLICVRYRYDTTARRRYKTIEIIVEEKEWEPKEPAQARQEQQTDYDATLTNITEDPPQKSQPPKPTLAFKPKTYVGIHVSSDEAQLIDQLRKARSLWIPSLEVWQVTYAQATALDLTDRIVGTIAELVAAKTLREQRHRPPEQG